MSPANSRYQELRAGLCSAAHQEVYAAGSTAVRHRSALADDSDAVRAAV